MDLSQGEPSPDIESGIFRDLVETSLSKEKSVHDQFFQRCEPNCRKMPILQFHRIFKKFLDPDLYADDFWNLTSFSLLKDTSLLQFSWISDEWFFCEIANSKTDEVYAG